jgi:ankyrin repeat protein
MPTEILQEISAYLSVSEVSLLIRVSKRMHTGLVRTLYCRALEQRTSSNTVLTNRLQDVTFWFDKTGSRSVLEWAAANGHFSTFRRLLNTPRADLLQLDRYGVTLLHRLAGQGFIQYMEPLIDRLGQLGIDPFQVDHSLLTPLHYAAGRGMTAGVHTLVKLGADVTAEDHYGNTPLHLAAVRGEYQVFAQLIEAGADVNSEGRFNWTPIDQASISHQHVAVNELRKLGSLPPTWHQRPNALNEFVQLSPCPLECYLYHVNF